MRARDVFELLLLAVLWGAAYLFMRAAVPAFGPAPLVALRMGLAAALLLPLMLWRGGWPELRAHPGKMLILGIPFTAAPFMLLGFASQHITAGLMAVLNATAPLFGALLAHYWLKQRMGVWRAAGLVTGFTGVAMLMWGTVSFKSNAGLLAVAAVLLTSMTWSLGAQYTRKHFAAVDPLVLTVGSLATASLVLAPFALAYWPALPPSPRAWAELVFLGVGSSGLGFIIYFRLLRSIGPVRAISVTLLNPVVAMVSGSFYLGEAITLQMVLGGAVVLLGTALGLGLIGPAPAAPEAAREAKP